MSRINAPEKGMHLRLETFFKFILFRPQFAHPLKCLRVQLSFCRKEKKRENKEEFKLRDITQTERERERRKRAPAVVSYHVEQKIASLSLHLKVRGKMFCEIAARNLGVIVLIWVSFNG
jgi:hypothetical protein